MPNPSKMAGTVKFATGPDPNQVFKNKIAPELEDGVLARLDQAATRLGESYSEWNTEAKKSGVDTGHAAKVATALKSLLQQVQKVEQAVSRVISAYK